MSDFLNCDVIMAQTRFFPTTLLAATLASRMGKRICVVDHGAGPLRSAPAFARASMLYEHLITSALKSFSPRFFAVSSASAGWLKQFGIQGASIVPNGIAPRESLPSFEGWPGKTITVFYAGRLLADKGVRELIDGVALLVKRGRRVELRIAGAGPLSPWIEQRALRCSFLKYLGAVPEEVVEAELAHSSIVVNPSNLREGFSRLLLEAGSAGLPVISTPFGACGEIIRSGETGWLISRGDPQQIADCIESVLADPDEARRRTKALFNLVQERYAWPVIVRTFLESSTSNNGRIRELSKKEQKAI